MALCPDNLYLEVGKYGMHKINIIFSLAKNASSTVSTVLVQRYLSSVADLSATMKGKGPQQVYSSLTLP